MIFEVKAFGPLGTNSYLVSDAGKAYLFDAPQGSYKYWKHRLNDLSLLIGALFLTHSHWDHIIDAAAIQREFKCPLWIHSEDRENLEKPGSDGLPRYIDITPAKADYFFSEGQKIDLEGLQMEVIHTPGHTPGGVCFYFKEKKIVIVGDTLFQGGIGRLDLPTSSPDAMQSSLKKLLDLPPETVVYPGHGDPTTIEKETRMIKQLCQGDIC